MRPAGGNHRTIRRYVEEVWRISISHFDPRGVSVEALTRRGRIPLHDVLTSESTYSRGHLKERLYQAGLKERRCELCGQGEAWRGERMSLILDHVNGVATDNRLENLRIVCPNCAATLPTHCGRNLPRTRACAHCGTSFSPNRREQVFCSAGRGTRARCSGPKPGRRKAKRPPEIGRASWRGRG